MILDALLKTKSRTVLIDIINKNGNVFLAWSHTVRFVCVVGGKICSRGALFIYLFIQRITVVSSLRVADAAQHNEAVQEGLQKDTYPPEASQGA